MNATILFIHYFLSLLIFNNVNINILGKHAFNFTNLMK